ncbi:MAG: hypothetical protein LUG99_07225 [Lachnospiraceae bacterium]|nr:hypothetical protein [Lachnospiraceae bacterium]
MKGKIANRKMISRRYRNRRIGDFLKELHLVEGRNTGIPTILRAMQQNGSDLPVFETDAERTYLTVILPVHQQFLPDANVNGEKKKRTRLTTAEMKQMMIESLSVYGELSSSELVKELGYSKLTAALGKAMKELIEEGKIEYTHPENLKHRNQKLRICLSSVEE